MILAEGMEIPADGILIEGAEVSANESAMTGEAEPMQKASLAECLNRKKEFLMDVTNKKGSHSVPSPILLSGSKILQGEGKFLVVVVGIRNLFFSNSFISPFFCFVYKCEISFLILFVIFFKKILIALFYVSIFFSSPPSIIV